MKKVCKILILTALVTEIGRANKPLKKMGDNTYERAELRGGVVSCSNLVVYQLSEDNKSDMEIFIDTKKIALTKSNTFDLSDNQLPISVRIRRLSEAVDTSLCNDVKQVVMPLEEIRVNTGKIVLNISEIDRTHHC